LFEFDIVTITKVQKPRCAQPPPNITAQRVSQVCCVYRIQKIETLIDDVVRCSISLLFAKLR